MTTHLTSICVAVAAFLALAPTSQAQHRHQQHGQATSRHCQTDYDHRPHYYHSGTHYHYCPGGAHYHGGGHSHGGRRYARNYDPLVVDVQRVLEREGHYAHAHHQADGIYGPETADAIRSYQRTKGLPITGQMDEALFAAMGITVPGYGAAGPNVVAPSNPGTAPTAPVEPAVTGDILTPVEAAAILRVSETDVITLLEKGELIGKQIGSSWRISRGALETYMKTP